MRQRLSRIKDPWFFKSISQYQDDVVGGRGSPTNIPLSIPLRPWMCLVPLIFLYLSPFPLALLLQVCWLVTLFLIFLHSEPYFSSSADIV